MRGSRLYAAVNGSIRVDRKRLYANRPSLAYLGLTLEQWQGITDPLWFFHPYDRERVAKEVYAGSGSEGPHEFEARFLRADGEYRWFLFRDNPLRDERGTPSAGTCRQWTLKIVGGPKKSCATQPPNYSE